MAWTVEPRAETQWSEGEREEARAAFLKLCVENYERRFHAPYDIYPLDEDRSKAWELQRLLQDAAFCAEITAALAANEEDRWKSEVQFIATTAAQTKDRLKALELLGEANGFVKKGTTINNNNNVDARTQQIFRVPYFETQDEFKAQFKKQQTELIANARSN